MHGCVSMATVPAGSPSRGGDVAVYFFDIKQPSLPTPSYSILVSVSVFMAFSTVFLSINSLDNCLLSYSVLLPYWSTKYLFITPTKVYYSPGWSQDSSVGRTPPSRPKGC